METVPMLKVPSDNVRVPPFETAPETFALAVPFMLNVPLFVKAPVERVVAPTLMVPELVRALVTVNVRAPAVMVPVLEFVRLSADNDPFASEKSASFTAAPETFTLAVPFRLK